MESSVQNLAVASRTAFSPGSDPGGERSRAFAWAAHSHMKVQSRPFQIYLEKAVLHVDIPSVHPEDPEEVGSTEDAERF